MGMRVHNDVPLSIGKLFAKERVPATSEFDDGDDRVSEKPLTTEAPLAQLGVEVGFDGISCRTHRSHSPNESRVPRLQTSDADCDVAGRVPDLEGVAIIEDVDDALTAGL